MWLANNLWPNGSLSCTPRFDDGGTAISVADSCPGATWQDHGHVHGQRRRGGRAQKRGGDREGDNGEAERDDADHHRVESSDRLQSRVPSRALRHEGRDHIPGILRLQNRGKLLLQR